MSKTMETKMQILERLEGKKKTVTQLSEELGLAKSTVSQHMSELQRMGKVREADNGWFKKVKYFELASENKPQPMAHLQYRLGVSLLAILISALLLYQLAGAPQNPNFASVSQPNQTNQPGSPAVQSTHSQPAFYSEAVALIALIILFTVYFAITARRLLKMRAARSP